MVRGTSEACQAFENKIRTLWKPPGPGVGDFNAKTPADGGMGDFYNSTFQKLH